MAGAFQNSAFQNSAYQTDAAPPPPVPFVGGGGGGLGGIWKKKRFRKGPDGKIRAYDLIDEWIESASQDLSSAKEARTRIAIEEAEREEVENVMLLFQMMSDEDD